MNSYDPALLDLPKLQTWLVSQGLVSAELDAAGDGTGGEIAGSAAGGDALISAETLTGGRSNVMFSIQVEGSPSGRRPDGERQAEGQPAPNLPNPKNWVLRRPATVAIERANDGMRREFRILSALDSTPVPHPHTIALCEDLEVLGCVFYLMEKINGIVPAGELPEAFTQKENYRSDLAFALVDALAALHNVTWQQVGLADFGRPDGFHERQVKRWGAQLASYQGRDIPDLATAGAWLETHMPQRWSPAIMHGDYHMFNVLIHPEPPAKVAAIVDWETATIGDPLLDFVGFCEAWQSMRSGGGWPPYEAMLERYLSLRQLNQLSQRPTPQEQQYYGVLYNFRMAVLLEGIYQRSLRDPNRKNQEAIGERALFNAARCQTIISDVACLFN